MIGQQKIKDIVSKWKSLPRFLILIGEEGCGKKTLAAELAKKYLFNISFLGNKVDDIRTLISAADSTDSHIMFVLDNGDDLTSQAAETMLKTAEEVPNNSVIVLCCENIDKLTPTIISRGFILKFEPYISEDYKQYCLENNLDYSENDIFTIPNLSGYLLGRKSIDYMHELADKTCASMRIANGANAFKILEKVKIKDSLGDISISVFLFCLLNSFFEAFKKAALAKDLDEMKLQRKYIDSVEKAKQSLWNRLNGKQMIMDSLVLDLWGASRT